MSGLGTIRRLRVFLPQGLRPFAGGASTVEWEQAEAPLAEVLAALWERHPALRDRLFSEDGRWRPHVRVFVGTEDVRWTGDLATRVPEGAEITIVPAVSGG